MGTTTGIDWTDHTWNPWQGCRKVSAGCLNCYMHSDFKRYGKKHPEKVIRSKGAFYYPNTKWKKPARVFASSWTDFFISDADQWRDAAWDIIRDNTHLTFQLLTKRPENIKDRLPADWPLNNVWLGVTAENQEMADKRIPVLLEIPAVIHFVSIEPMLSAVSLAKFSGIDWVICGGETHKGWRPMDEQWAADLMNETKAAFFMKQMANKRPIPDYLKRREFPNGTTT